MFCKAQDFFSIIQIVTFSIVPLTKDIFHYKCKKSGEEGGQKERK